ncbi:MAG TPA: serine/threonine-protein kinase [Kofleriaceae bacterium]|nr:serine/threonine-protein kinase [Kofleriaceae bacterium]
MTDGNPEGTGVKPSLLIRGYEVSRRIAIGGMAEVFLATQVGPSGFRRQVVLKRIHPHLADEPQFLSMFLNEARIAADLSHPNIVHIYDLFQDGPTSYVIAMEYVHGETVFGLFRETRQKNVRISYGHIVRMIVSVCEALHYAWEEPASDGRTRRIIHRDVSPSNILVGVDGQVKLADFGIAKALQSEGLTKVATLKGKYGYMSPEQVRCEPLDNRSDIFSLGAMLYEMTVGRRLFRRESDLKTLQAILVDPIALPSTVALDYPPDLEPIVMRALARNRDERYPTARAMAEDLNDVARKNSWDAEIGALASLVRQVVADRPAAAASPFDWIQPAGAGVNDGRIAATTPTGQPSISATPSPMSASFSNMGRQTFSEFTGGLTGSIAGIHSMAGPVVGPLTGQLSSQLNSTTPGGASGLHQLPQRVDPLSEQGSPFSFDEPSRKTTILILVALFVLSLAFWLWAVPRL